MVKSLRKYVAVNVRPTLLEKGIFHPPAVSSTVATGLVARNFVNAQPDYYIKVASDNPLNQSNKPEPLEQSLLQRFRDQPGLDDLTEVGMIGNKQFLVSAKPSHAKAGCMVCHGELAKAKPAPRQPPACRHSRTYRH